MGNALPIIILFVFILIILLVIAIVKSKMNYLKRQDEYIEENVNNKVEFNHFLQTFTVNDEDSKTYNYKQIVDFELLEDGSTLIQGSAMDAIAGGLLFGGVGAIVGSNIGTKQSTNMCHSLEIKITLRDNDTPSIYIPFIDNYPVNKNSDLYRNIFTEAQNTLSALKLAMDQVSDKTQTSNISGADEIMKYKKLLDDGIITQEEFDAKKTQILNRD